MSKKRRKKKKRTGAAIEAQAQVAETSDAEAEPEDDSIDRDPTPLPPPVSYADLETQPIALVKEESAPEAEIEVPPTRVVERGRADTANLPVTPPPYGFLKGAVLGLVVLLPLTAFAVYLLAQIGIGDPDATYTQVIAFVAVFGGLPAILSSGGIGRVAARTAVAPRRGGTGWSILVSALATGVVGAGVVILSVVPLGEVPVTLERWLWMIGFGGGAGLVVGIVIGLWVSYGSPQSRPTS
jgi:hypothetical protein